MPHLLTERLRPLQEAAREIPGRPHISTVLRWCLKGIKGGIKLETILVGGKRFTSVEAIERFVARLSAPQRPTDNPEPDRRTEDELTRLGY